MKTGKNFSMIDLKEQDTQMSHPATPTSADAAPAVEAPSLQLGMTEPQHADQPHLPRPERSLGDFDVTTLFQETDKEIPSLVYLSDLYPESHPGDLFADLKPRSSRQPHHEKKTTPIISPDTIKKLLIVAAASLGLGGIGYGVASFLLAPDNTQPTEATSTPQAEQSIAVAPNRTTVITYDARAGEDIVSLAQRFGITEQTLMQVNGLTSANIPVGAKLMIPPGEGIAHEIQKDETLLELAIRYNVNVDKLIAVNGNIKPESLQIGQKVFIPGAKAVIKPSKQVQAAKDRRAMRIALAKTNRSLTSAPRTVFPLPGGNVSSTFGPRWGSFHQGIDITKPIGSPIMAAKSGEIVVASWSGGYGYMVEIDHGNGMTTRYGHCSRLFVSPGQRVRAGDKIAAVGSTGHSTGPHLHFEVRRNGTAINPNSLF